MHTKVFADEELDEVHPGRGYDFGCLACLLVDDDPMVFVIEDLFAVAGKLMCGKDGHRNLSIFPHDYAILTLTSLHRGIDCFW